MPRRSIENSHIRKLIKLGNGSLAVTIPIHIAREMGFREKQKVTVYKKGSAIVIKDWEK